MSEQQFEMQIIPDNIIADAKRKTLLSGLIRKDIEIKKKGKSWTALCPFHPEKSPSFFINDDNGLYHCFGCGAGGDAVSYLEKKHGLSFPMAIERLLGEKPLTEARQFEENLRDRANEHVVKPCWDYNLDEGELSNQGYARSIWEHAIQIEGTPAERYLRTRGITARALPPTLRYMDAAWIYSAKKGWSRTDHPAMIAAIQDSRGQVTAIQSTYLLADGSWKATMAKPKLSVGPMQDGAIRLSRTAPLLGIAEGIETALSAQKMYSVPVWASTGQSRRKSILLPDTVREVIIFADNSAKPDLTTELAARSYEGQGRTVYVEYPPKEFKDFNSQLLRKKDGPEAIQPVVEVT